MTLVLHRTIHPVGQGAFYSEVFEDDGNVKFTMVYDCGTETKDRHMDKTIAFQIDEFAKKIGNKKIDLLFISHFHEDHISGIQTLINKCGVIKTIIPMLTDELILLTRVRNLIRYKQEALDTDDIIHELFYGEGNRFGKIEKVKPDDKDFTEDVLYPKRGDSVSCKNEMVQRDVFWMYRPFNSISPRYKKAIELKKQLLQSIPDVFDQNGFFDATKAVGEHLKDLKEIYRKVIKGPDDNLYTLVVESSPVEEIMSEGQMKNCRGVYFGDFDYLNSNYRDWDKYRTLLSPDDYSKIGLVQVPHHGSKLNWHVDFLCGTPRQYVISVGTTNGHNHPSYWVVKEIENNGNIVNVVSEKAATKLELDYVVR